jgi:O-antigen/teichoic acid export membrane protein
MILAIIRGIVLVPLYLTYIGKDLYGIWLALASTVALLGLIDLGITSIASQRTAVYCGANDYESLGCFLGTMILFNLCAVTVIGGIGYVMAPWLPRWFGIQGPFANQLVSAFRVATLNVMLMLIVSMVGSVLFGLQKPGAHIYSMIVGTTGEIFVIIALLFSGWGILAIPIGSLIRPLVTLPTNLWAIRAHLKTKVTLRMIRITRKMTKGFLRVATWIGPAKTAETFIPQLDNIIVIKLLRPMDVTILVLTRKVADIVVQLIGRLSASMMSGFAHLHGSGEKEKYRQIVIELFRITAYFICVAFSGVYLVNADFVSLWTSPSLFGGDGLTVLICLYGLLKVFRITFYNTIFSQGEIRITSLASILEVAIQTSFGIAMGWAWGIKGVVAAGIIAVTVGGVIQARVLVRIIEFDIKMLSRGLWTIVRTVMPAFLLGLFIHRFWQPAGWVGLILFGAVYVLVAVLCIGLQEPKLIAYFLKPLKLRLKAIRVW